MRRPLIAALVGIALVLGTWTAFRDATAQAPGGPGGPPPEGQRPPRPMQPAATDSFAAERDSLARSVLADIAGRETMPAESVFKNIKIFKKTPAGQLVRIMNQGFGRALGARCRLCHIQGHWDAEDKREKATARLMIAMVDTLNSSFLSQIKHRDGSTAHAGCFTCHRGHPNPNQPTG